VKKSPSNSALRPQLALAVRIGKDVHVIPIDVIVEVLPALPIEAIPQCPSFVRGVVFVRGHLIPVFDAAERLGLRNHGRPPEPPIVCLRVGSRLVGLEVDEALDLIDIPLSTALPVEEVNAQSGFLTGLVEVDGEVIRILDVERMVARQEAVALEALPRTASK
jgi:purine-binding chemotaxis protein CheW